MPVFGRQHIRKDDKSKLTRLWDKETKPNTLLHDLRNAYLTGFDLVDARDEYKAEAVRQNRFTADGLTAAVRDYSVAASAKIKRARSTIAKARDRLAELEVATTVPTVDQSEAASRLRDRIWRQLERIPEGPGRDRTILSMAEKNPVVADAIREMPKELAGISASAYDEITLQLRETVHGPKLAEIEELRDGISIAESAVEAADEDLRVEVGVFDARKWQELTEHVKPERPIPWLKKVAGEVKVLRPTKDGFSAASPSDEDIADGRFFENIDQFKSANVAA